MKCRDVEKYLQAYVDGEFSDLEENEIEQHFKFCPACQQRVAFESWFKKGMKASIKQQASAPRSLKANIAFQVRRQRRAEVPVWMKLAPAMVIMVLAAGIFFFPRIEVKSPIVEATVDTHLRDLPFDVQSEDFNKVRAYFQQKINYPVRIPHFRHRKVRLIGGRISSIEDRHAAYMAFKGGNGHRYSMMAKPMNDGVAMPDGQTRTVNDRTYTIVSHHGYNVVLWNAGGMLYSLAGNDAPDDLIKLVSDADYDN